MTEQTRTALKKLQRLDTRIADVRQEVRDFDPLFEEVEEPALVLESELENTRKRLKEMRLEERRLELSVEEKQARVKKLEERLGNVRNLREEAATSAELDMVRRALQSDEQEAYTLLDQIRKLEDRESEVSEAYKEADAQVGPARDELLAKRDSVKQQLAELEERRGEFAGQLAPNELRMYEGIRSGGRRVAVADLTEDGACTNCYGVVPLQVQNEIRHGTSLIRCEACGVILSAPDPEEEKAKAAAAAEASAEAADGAEADAAEDVEEETAAEA